MAVDFGNTGMEGGIAPSVTVQNPVQDDSGAVLANGLAGAAQWAGQMAGGIFKQQDDNAQFKVLNNYENDFLTIVDSYEQGVYTQQEAMLRARALRSQYLSNAPALRDDFDKVWTQVTKDSGLGHTLIEGTVRDRAAEAMELEGAKLGYNPQQWQQFQANARVLDAYKQQLELTTTQNGIVTEGQKQRGLELITNVAASAVPAAQKMVNDTIAQLDAAPDASGKAEVLTAFNLNIGNAMASIEGGALGVDTAYITKPMKDLQAMVTEYANGGVELTMLENSIKSTNLMYQQMQMKDPKIASAIATMATFKEMGMQNSPEMLTQLYDPEVLERIVAVNNGTAANFLDNTPASAKTFQTMTGVAATPGLSDQAQGEVLKFTNDVIDGIYKNERSAKDGALGYKDTVTYLASPGVRELIANKGISAEFAAEASDVIAKNYETVLGPAINQYWTSVPISDPTVGESVGISNIPMNQLLDPVWNGSAVEFVPKAEYASNPRVIALAGDVNTGPNSIGVPLNDNINAQSALTGTDAKSLWEGTYAQKWFGISKDGEEVKTQLDVTPPANNISDFQPETFEFADVEFDQASALNTELPPIDPAYTNVDGIDYSDYLPSIRASESSGNDQAANPNSTARGRYQFLTSTWNSLVNRYPNSGLSFDGRGDPNQQEVAIRLFTAENARQLANSGIPLNNGTLYAAHFLGAGDAAKVLRAPPSDSVANYVPSKVISANSFLRGMTVADFKAWAARKGNA